MRPDLQDKFPRLFVATLGGIVVLYITFGLLNWVAYGSHTDTVLTVNLPSVRGRSLQDCVLLPQGFASSLASSRGHLPVFLCAW